MVTLIKIAQVILALSILVLVHEFGHYFFARLFKIRVEKFYLFFDPWFSIFKYKPKGSETEYGIGWLPLGGYCKISGMIDESMDKEALKEEPKPWEFRSKPAWQRFFVMFGGVFFNFILAILIYSGTLFTWGEEYIKTEDAIYGVQCNDLALKMGFKHGDKILAFDSTPVERFNDLQITLARNQASTATLERDGSVIIINLDQNYLPQVLKTPGMFSPRFPFMVLEVQQESQNYGQLLAGDRIIAIDSIKTNIVQEIAQILLKHKDQKIEVTIERGDEIIKKELYVNPNGLLGVVLDGDQTKFFKITTFNYSAGSALVAGFDKSISTIGNYMKELKLIFSPKTEAYKSVGSFISIGKIFPASWDWFLFWNITGFLSIMLAVLNLLPIPALDGGHIIFLFYEIITRRKPSDKFMEYAQIVGMMLLFGIMFLAFGNDIYRLFK